MSDNVQITQGSGTTIGTRDVGGGVEVQRIIPNTFSGGVATDVSAVNPLPVDQGGRTNTAIPAGTAGNTIVKASSGRLNRVLVTATGTANSVIYDNATTNTGTIIGIVPSSATVGQVIDLRMPAANGITVSGAAAAPGYTVSFN